MYYQNRYHNVSTLDPELRQKMMRIMSGIVLVCSIVQLGFAAAIFDFGGYYRNSSGLYQRSGAWWAATVNIISSTICMVARSKTHHIAAFFSMGFAVVLGGIAYFIDNNTLQEVVSIDICVAVRSPEYAYSDTGDCDRLLRHNEFDCVCKGTYDSRTTDCYYFAMTGISAKSCDTIMGGLKDELIVDVRIQSILIPVFIVLVLVTWAHLRQMSAIVPVDYVVNPPANGIAHSGGGSYPPPSNIAGVNNPYPGGYNLPPTNPFYQHPNQTLYHAANQGNFYQLPANNVAGATYNSYYAVPGNSLAQPNNNYNYHLANHSPTGPYIHGAPVVQYAEPVIATSDATGNKSYPIAQAVYLVDA